MKLNHRGAQASRITWPRWTATSIAALTSACLALMPSGLYAHDVTPPSVPTIIKVPAGHKPFLRGRAVGTQNFVCSVSTTGSFFWSFYGPQATLFDDNAAQIMTHFLSGNPDEAGKARPTWLHSRDTSAVWAEPIQSSMDPAFVEPGAIPWLLLAVRGAETGPTDGDKLTGAIYLHRVHTSGGVAPTTGCTQASEVGNKNFVPYAADYYFYKARRK